MKIKTRIEAFLVKFLAGIFQQSLEKVLDDASKETGAWFKKSLELNQWTAKAIRSSPYIGVRATSPIKVGDPITIDKMLRTVEVFHSSTSFSVGEVVIGYCRIPLNEGDIVPFNMINHFDHATPFAQSTRVI